ncbi:TIGR02556 family CRISPR-associated protein [Caldithrix abyssi]
MLSAIKEIGKWQIEQSGKNTLDVLIKSPFKNEGKMIFIEIDLDQKIFCQVSAEDFEPEKKTKYLFRGGVSQGPNPTPIALVNVKNPEKTFHGKVLKWFDKYAANADLSDEDSNLSQTVKDILTGNSAQILEEINNTLQLFSKKEKKALSIKLKQDREYKYIGDFTVFRILLQKTEAKKATTKKGKITSASNKICAVCGIQRDSVSGNASPFKFYTIDKPGFITGGFNEKLSWRNFPVCSECKLFLEEGKRFVDENLSFKFHGLNYWLIPKQILGDINNDSNILESLLESKKISLKKEIKKVITNAEDEILDTLAQEKDVLTLNFLFIRKDNSAERILLLIEDIFPSRIKRIFEAKDAVDKISGGSFTFGNIREFFAKSDENKRNYDLDKYFLEITDKVFRGTSLDFKFLTRFFMRKIRRAFIEDNYFNSAAKSALMCALFFNYLGILDFQEVGMEENIFDGVFDRYEKLTGNPAKRGLFLLGSLTQMLLNKQWRDRNAKPFMKQLKGLKLDEKDMMALLPKIQNKLEEYDAFDKGKRKLAKAASQYLLKSGHSGKMSVDEINFYFVCGMNLVNEVADVVYPKPENNEEE